MPATKRKSAGASSASKKLKTPVTSTTSSPMITRSGRILGLKDTNTPKKPYSGGIKSLRINAFEESPLAAKSNPTSIVKGKQTVATPSKKPRSNATSKVVSANKGKKSIALAAKSSGITKATPKKRPGPKRKSNVTASRTNGAASKPSAADNRKPPSPLTGPPPPTGEEKINTAFISAGYIEFWTPSDRDPPDNTQPVLSIWRKPEKSYTHAGAYVSEPAYARLCNMYNNCVHATPEANDIIHIFEDYRGYGIMEVIEHEIVEYQKLITSKKAVDGWELWIRAETLALFFAGHDNMEWLNVDDGEKVGQLIHLCAWLFLDALSRLTPTDFAGIENLGLIVGSMCVAIGMDTDAYEDCEEIWRIEDWAKENGVEMKYVRAAIQPYECDPREDEEGYVGDGKDDWKEEFKKEFGSFKKRYGGKGFGKITMGLQNVSKADKKKMNKGEVGTTWLFSR